MTLPGDICSEEVYIHKVPVQIRRRGVETKLTLDGPDPTLSQDEGKLISGFSK